MMAKKECGEEGGRGSTRHAQCALCVCTNWTFVIEMNQYFSEILEKFKWCKFCDIILLFPVNASIQKPIPLFQYFQTKQKFLLGWAVDCVSNVDAES